MMMLSKLNGIAARIAIAILFAIIVGLVLAVGVSIGLSWYGFRQDHSPYASGRIILVTVVTHRNLTVLSSEIAMTIRAAALVPPPERPRLIEIAAKAAPETRMALDAPAPSQAEAKVDYNLDRLRKLVQMQVGELSPPVTISARRAPVQADQASERDPSGAAAEAEAVLEAAMPDGQRIIFTIAGLPAFGGYVLPVFLASLVFVAILIALWTARRLAGPIREFANAAERLGVDLTAPPLAVRGPQELRTTIEAVNRMQDRLRRFLEDRTQMLAAISHDLRAPLARLRLRAELVADGEQQCKMFDDLESMNAMIDSTLAFARDDARQEPRRLVDLGVLVEDVCEDVADAGGEVRYLGPRGIDVPCRPSLVGRAVANLIDNAVKYGRVARVKIVRDTDRVVIVVEDDGPGIPPLEQEKVFAPFYRLGPARDPAKAGVGLGLSIARTIAREHGGDVTLANADAGGLSVRFELPAQPGVTEGVAGPPQPIFARLGAPDGAANIRDVIAARRGRK
jgi:signal transduction histidine kinase